MRTILKYIKDCKGTVVEQYHNCVIFQKPPFNCYYYRVELNANEYQLTKNRLDGCKYVAITESLSRKTQKEITSFLDSIDAIHPKLGEIDKYVRAKGWGILLSSYNSLSFSTDTGNYYTVEKQDKIYEVIKSKLYGDKLKYITSISKNRQLDIIKVINVSEENEKTRY